jgi:hypothetical protein
MDLTGFTTLALRIGNLQKALRHPKQATWKSGLASAHLSVYLLLSPLAFTACICQQ